MKPESKVYRPTHKGSSTPAALLMQGKVPPQALSEEAAVLGVLMLEQGRLDEVRLILPQAECFYTTQNQLVYKAILALHKISIPADILTVSDQLRKTEDLERVGGPFYVTKLTEDVNTGAHLLHHARIVAEKWMKRQMIALAGNMMAAGYDESVDVFESLETAAQDLQEISTPGGLSGPKAIEDVYALKLREIDEQRSSGMEILGAATGFPALNEILNGIRRKSLTILAARPSVGKTAFALQLAGAMAADTQMCGGVVYFSMEMDDRELVERKMAELTGVYYGNIQKPMRLTEDDLLKLAAGVHHLPQNRIFIDDSTNLSWLDMKGKMRILRDKYGITHAIVDYLQLMSGDKATGKGNREQEISSISRELKNTAKDLDMGILALSQMSRAIESRADGIPKLSDLRESGAIEQDANVVMFLWRPPADDIANDPGAANLRTIFVEKNRGGSTGKVDLMWNGGLQRFSSLGTAPFTNQPANPVPENAFSGMKHNPAGGSKLFVQDDADKKDDVPF